jgi:hypothetical protein
MVLISAALATASPALAEYYIVKNTDTHKCTISPRPTTATNLDESAGLVGRESIIGSAGFKSRDEALSAMRTAKACAAK